MSRPPESRPYQRSGHYALRATVEAARSGHGAGWLDQLGPAGEAAKEWRAQLIADLGGDVTAQQLVVIEASTRTLILLEAVDKYLLAEAGGGVVNKSRRALFPVVSERQRLSDALVRYMSVLGLERRARPVTTLAELLAERAAARGEAPTLTGRSHLTDTENAPSCSEPQPAHLAAREEDEDGLHTSPP